MYRVVYSADTVVPKSAKLTRLSAVQVGKYNSVVKGLIGLNLSITFAKNSHSTLSLRLSAYLSVCRFFPIKISSYI